MTGIIHQDDTRLALHVLDPDDAHLGIDRPERDPLRVFRSIVIIPEPGFPGVPIVADDQTVKSQLGKAPVAGGDSCREHIADGHAYRPDDLVFVKGYIRIAFCKGPAAFLRLRMVMRRTDHQLVNSIFFLADLLHALTGEHRQVDGNKCQAPAILLQHQAAGIYRIVEGLVARRRDIHLGGAGQ